MKRKQPAWPEVRAGAEGRRRRFVPAGHDSEWGRSKPDRHDGKRLLLQLLKNLWAGGGGHYHSQFTLEEPLLDENYLFTAQQADGALRSGGQMMAIYHNI